MKEEDINAFFKDKEKQLELINKFQPGFLKFDENGKFEINRTVKLNIPPETIVFSKEIFTDSDTLKAENNFDDNLVTKGTIKSNLNISKSIKNIIGINFENNLTIENSNSQNSASKSVRYKHCVTRSFIKLSIPQDNFKLDEKIKNEFRKATEKETDKEKMDELLKLFNAYGIGIPFEYLFGGKFYMYFDAKNDEEKNEIVRNFNNLASLSISQSKFEVGFGNNEKNDIKQQMAHTNIKLSVIGGDSEKKDDYNAWFKSLNLNNSEIIQYKILRPIHDFCDEDVKKEIDDLLERENKKRIEEAEKELKKNNIIEKQENKITNDNDLDKDVDEDILIMILGDGFSGKTTFMKRYSSGKSKIFKTKKTISAKHLNKIETIKIDNIVYKINVVMQENPIDTKILNDFKLPFLSYGDSIILIVDISKEDSINNLKIWNDLIVKYNKKKIPVLLLPTKYDLIDKNQMTSIQSNLRKVCENFKWFLLYSISNLIDDKKTFNENMRIIINKTYKSSKKNSYKVIHESSGCW